MKDENELLLGAELNTKPIVEIGRLKFNGSGASVYLPKDIVNALHLKKNEQNSLIIISYGDNRCLLIKDTEAALELKSDILDKRKGSSSST